MIRLKVSPNGLILVLNLSLFAIQCLLFMSWTPKSPEVTLEVTDRGETVLGDDEVIVFNGKLIQEDSIATTARKTEPKPETTEGSTWNWNWDGRSDKKPKGNRYIFLVRHGQYYGSGPLERHLSTIGKQQAQKTGEKLRSFNLTFTRLISSTSIRAAETAGVIHKVLGHNPDIEFSDELREGWPSYPDPATPGTWDREDPVFILDVPRIQSAFEKFIHRANVSQQSDCNEIMVAHGNIIAYIILRSLQVPVERWLKLSVFQGSMTMLQLHPSGDVTVRSVGDIGHLTKREWTG